MIARIAPSAIWRPKLAETLLTLVSAWNALFRPSVRRVCSSGVEVRADPELPVRPARQRVAGSLDLRAALTGPLRRLGAHLFERGRLRRRQRDLRAALEVDAEVQAVEPDRADREHQDDARHREPAVPQADEVAPDPRRRLALGAHQARVVEPAEAAEQPEDGARRRDRGQQRHQGSDQQHQREALHACGRDEEEDDGGDRGDDVRVDDRREALAVTRRDRGAHRLAGAVLLLHALEDDDVRVGGHPQRQDHPCEARQGQRDVEDQDRRVEEGGVDAEADHGDDAEHAVEDEQEERDDEEARDCGLPGLRERVRAERGRDCGLLLAS